MDPYEIYADEYCTGEWDVNALKNTVMNLISGDKDEDYWLHRDRRDKLKKEIRDYTISQYATVEKAIDKFMDFEHPDAKDLNADDVLYAACISCVGNDGEIYPLNRDDSEQVSVLKYNILFKTDQFIDALVHVSAEKKKRRNLIAAAFKKSSSPNANYIDITDLENIIGRSSKFDVFYAPDAVKYDSPRYGELEDDYLNFVTNSVFDMLIISRYYNSRDRATIRDGIKLAAVTNKMTVSNFVDRINPENEFNRRCEDALILDLFDNILEHANHS